MRLSPPPTSDADAAAVETIRSWDRLVAGLVAVGEPSLAAAKRYIEREDKETAEARIRQFWREWSG